MDASFHAWTSLWPYAIIMVVIGSWAFYHFFAPKSWRDWAGAGLVQAFIIALYAEMYGFPLTIYFLTTTLPLEIPLVHYSGHLWATLLGYGAGGAVVEMLVGYAFVTTGLILVIKGWTKVYFFGDQLLTEGVYGFVRHPQYTGLFLVVFGQIVHWPTIPTLFLSPVIVLVYVQLARQEERRMLAKFGDGYRVYQSEVPMFIPRWQRLRVKLGA